MTELARRATLMRAIMEFVPGEQSFITETTRRELLALGIPQPAAHVTADRTVSKDNVLLMCVILDAFDPPVLPDNQADECDGGCGRMIQFRPSAMTATQKLCCYCMAGAIGLWEGLK